MMKKLLATLTTTALIGFAPFALAASSTDLTVTGSITPSACTPALSGGGVVDLGKIAAKDLNPTLVTTFTFPMEVTVNCDAPMTFGLHGIDNNPGTAAQGNTYGLGLTAANEKIGSFSPQIKTVKADNVDARAIYSIDNGATWIPAHFAYPNRSITTSTLGTMIPIPVQNLVMNVDATVWISAANDLTLTDQVTIDGSATFEMRYL